MVTGTIEITGKIPENRKELDEVWEEFKYKLDRLAIREWVKIERKKKEKSSSLHLVEMGHPGVSIVTEFTFICPIDFSFDMDIEDATHSLSDAFLPSKRMQKEYGVYGLICRHCKDTVDVWE
jgi:hypothetical protein